MNTKTQQLIIDYIPLANKIAFKYFQKTPKKISFEEIKSFAYFGLVNAALKFNEKKGSFSNYAKIRINGEIKDNLRKSSKFDKISQRNFEESFFFTQYNIDTDDFFNFICEKIEEIEKFIIQMYFIENKTMKEIGDMKSISESRVSQILKSCLNKIKNNFSQENFLQNI